MPRRLFALLLASHFAVACFSLRADEAALPPDLPPEANAILNRATDVKLFRLSGDRTADADPKNWRAGPAWQGDRLKAVAAALQDPARFMPIRKRCEPRPGVAMVLSDGKSSVTVKLCFECTVMIVSSDAPPVERQLHFDPSRSLWAGWAKEAFPDDAQIQKIKGKDMPPEERERLTRELEKLERDLKERAAKKSGEPK
jgi:hypothetical protein